MSVVEYKRSYTLIFVFYYLCEGFLQGIPFLVWPSFIADQLGGSYDIAIWLVIYLIGKKSRNCLVNWIIITKFA